MVTPSRIIIYILFVQFFFSCSQHQIQFVKTLTYDSGWLEFTFSKEIDLQKELLERVAISTSDQEIDIFYNQLEFNENVLRFRNPTPEFLNRGSIIFTIFFSEKSIRVAALSEKIFDYKNFIGRRELIIGSQFYFSWH